MFVAAEVTSEAAPFTPLHSPEGLGRVALALCAQPAMRALATCVATRKEPEQEASWLSREGESSQAFQRSHGAAALPLTADRPARAGHSRSAHQRFPGLLPGTEAADLSVCPLMPR